ncbi:MAG TPA: bifunctional UDP-N-acetylglucosamine diphosphorylase/glucosamine-1-phosphate N-acetyltransferase GlmU [Terriglobia bacterium]|nr:bifunctional UDP-N-acetylglucosamine diphosphorylase/glucosamine-1-phosphate N-acetyltransferase GlmU [Terriglobia bacterium]
MAKAKPRPQAPSPPEPPLLRTFSVLILAAGRATRFQSEHSKVLHRLAGKPLGEYVLRAALAARPERTAVIVGHEAEEVEEALARPGVTFIQQIQQLGTGHAVRIARGQIEKWPSPSVVVLVGDVPLLRSQTLRDLVDAHLGERAAVTILTTRVEDPSGYGRVVRVQARSRKGSTRAGLRAAASGLVRAIVEEKVATPAERRIREISSGILCFSRPKLLAHLDRLSNQNAQHEYLLTDLVEILHAAGERVAAFEVADSREVLGVNDRVELAEVEKILRRRKAEALMRDGVTLVDPVNTYVDEDVEVGPDTILEPGVILSGKTRVGRGARLGPWATIVDSELADRVTVRQSSLIVGCQVAEDAVIGPFAHLRDGAVIESEVRIGNFVEVKKSHIGRHTRALHLTYLGDATLEENVNIGAGTVTCNYDGQRKHPTSIERGVFIGSGSMLVAPVIIGRGSYVAAGSTITEDVPPGSLALGRAHQVNKEGWVEERARRDEHESASEASSNPPGGTPAGERSMESEKKRNEPDLAVREAGTVTVIEPLSGLTRPGVAKQLSQAIRESVNSHRAQVVVNLAQVTLLDSAAVGELVAAVSAAKREGGVVKLSDLTAETLHILKAANLHHFLEIFPHEADAVASFGPPAA